MMGHLLSSPEFLNIVLDLMVIPLYSGFLDLCRRLYMVAKELSLEATVH